MPSSRISTLRLRLGLSPRMPMLSRMATGPESSRRLMPGTRRSTSLASSGLAASKSALLTMCNEPGIAVRRSSTVATTSIVAALRLSSVSTTASSAVSAEPLTSTGSKSGATTRTVRGPSGIPERVKFPKLSVRVTTPDSTAFTVAVATGKPPGPVTSPLMSRACRLAQKSSVAAAQPTRQEGLIIDGSPCWCRRFDRDEGSPQPEDFPTYLIMQLIVN